jgi:tetratricopeptide (TPR) repeat protein
MGTEMMFVAGEPGIGKTCLLQEVAVRAGKAGWTVLAAGCHPQSGQEPYEPLLGALAGYLSSLPRARLRVALEGCVWLMNLLPELAELSAVAVPAWSLPAEQERRLMFAAVAQCLANVAGPGGVLLILDDLQWAGADALHLLAAVLRLAPGLSPPPVVRVVAAYRATDIHPGAPLHALKVDLVRHGKVTELHLGPLAQREASDLLTRLLGSDLHLEETVARAKITPAVQAEVLERAEGVPFFLVSYVQALEAGALDLATVGSAQVPWTVAETIRARLAALPTLARELLATAAVAGRVIPGDLFFGAHEHTVPEVLASLQTVRHAGLLVEQDGDYQFVHDLIREVILTDLGAAGRRVLHGRIAQTIERMLEWERSARAAELAWHFSEAGSVARALPYAIHAGNQAKGVYAYGEAERHYRFAVNLAERIGDKEHEARALEWLGDILHPQARYSEASDIFKRAITLYGDCGNHDGMRRAAARLLREQRHSDVALSARLSDIEPILAAAHGGGPSPGAAELYRELARFHEDAGRYAEALAAIERADKMAITLGDTALRAEVVYTQGFILSYSCGQMAEAERAFEAAIALYETVYQQRPRLCATLNGAANVALCKGLMERAQRYASRALAIAEDVASPQLLAATCRIRGQILEVVGDWEEADADFTRAAWAGRKSGIGFEVGMASWGLGSLALARGAWKTACTALEEAHTIAASLIIDHELRQKVHTTLAERELVAGHPEAAHGYLEALVALLENEPVLRTRMLPWLAWATLDLGDVDSAERLLSEAVTQSIAQPQRIVFLQALTVQAMLAIRRGQWEAAEQALKEACTGASAMSSPWAEAKALFIYGQLHEAKGEHDQAGSKLEQALAICTQLGEGLYRPRIEQEIAGLAVWNTP